MNVLVYNYFTEFVDAYIWGIPLLFAIILTVIVYANHYPIIIRGKIIKKGMPYYILIIVGLMILLYAIFITKAYYSREQKYKVLYNSKEYEIVQGYYDFYDHVQNTFKISINDKIFNFETILGYNLNNRDLNIIDKYEYIMITHIKNKIILIEVH